MQLTLRFLAPYLSIAIFWFGFKNGWLAILGYHAQILWWARRDLPRTRPSGGLSLLLGLPILGAGPLLYFLLPHVTRVELTVWLHEFHLTGWALVLLIPYFGILHPVLEQIHWGPLRERTGVSHALFAGYHLLVLYSLLSLPWLILCATLLGGASVAWKYMARKSEGLAVPIASHVGADLGVITAAWLRSLGS